MFIQKQILIVKQNKDFYNFVTNYLIKYLGAWFVSVNLIVKCNCEMILPFYENCKIANEVTERGEVTMYVEVNACPLFTQKN